MLVIFLCSTLSVSAAKSRARPFSRLWSADGLAGLAIILITMIVSLATLVVVNLTHSTFLAGRSVGMVERQLQAEFALKSMVNVAAALLAADRSPRVDAKQDIWGMFMQGAPVPPEILSELGFNPATMNVYLEITPENAKLSIDELDIRAPVSESGKEHDERWKKIYTSLFQQLGFDDEVLEPDHTGLFPNQEFKSAELVENLATYQLTDLPEGSTKLPTGNGKITRIGDLVNIPGFTPRRISILTPYITTYGNALVNVNVALPRVLRALDPELNPDLIIQYMNNTGPIESVSQLQEIIDPTVAQRLTGRVTTESDWYQVIGKVEYGGGITYFARAIISAVKGATVTTRVELLQLF